jgi:hypothetical protein
MKAPVSDPRPDPGLCGTCRHAHVITSAKGSTFWRCRVHDRDEAWPKYPRLPVRACPHHAASFRTPPSDDGVGEGG